MAAAPQAHDADARPRLALRDVFPDVLRGVNIAEEARDMPVEKDMGAAEVVEPAQAPASKTESLRNKVAAKRGKAGEEVTLDSVLKAIEAAHNNADLTKAAEQAVKLGSDEDKAKARAAYSEKLAELKRAATQPNPETGEIPTPTTKRCARSSRAVIRL